ncbi:DUF4221 domain-containing protein [Aquiflexum gelatinilyticum]|uniref:DUF4221 domain-containing protein n=1 Tax=Aquiflexum gelatinilyticum TaxID=2961943 RepID=A0A9X2P2R7_9BACT|nr:DUF4221 domain-containing protein [Aquiflexum gelatinilyticum]MCR9014528.1 DUF4221 domain-containing protein [Aquiflexum gelatinilyticum]
MNKLFLLVAILILISCSKNNNENSTGAIGEINLEIDTVLVDSKGEVLMAGTFLGVFDLSEDKKYLYNFDGSSHQIEVIDLDKLVLDRKIQLEKEGPNGIENPNGLLDLGEGRFLFSNFNSWTVVNQDAQKISMFNYEKEKLSGDSLFGKEDLNPHYLFVEGKKEFYTIIDQIDQNSTTIGLVNLDTKTLKRIEIPQLEKLKDFRVLMTMSGSIASNKPVVSMYSWNDKILIGNNAINQFIIFDPKLESVNVKTFESKLTPNQKTPNEKVEVGSIEELIAAGKKLNEQIDFKNLNWDSDSQRFYRLSSISLPKPEGETINKADVFLTVFDKELNMIGEMKLDGFTKPPVTSFFKDGAIWIHQNLNDELGFIRIKVLEN